MYVRPCKPAEFTIQKEKSQPPSMRQFKHVVFELVLCNIVDQTTDAIVNAANTKLAGGGGVDGAIHRAAGPILKELCLQFPADENGRRCQTGCVQTTAGGNLAAKHVIHAVGPFYNEKYAEKAHGQLRQLHELALQRAAVIINMQVGGLSREFNGAYAFLSPTRHVSPSNTVCSFSAFTQAFELVLLCSSSQDT